MTLLEKFLGSKVSMGHLTNQLIRLVNPKSHQNGKRVKQGLLSHIGVCWKIGAYATNSWHTPFWADFQIGIEKSFGLGPGYFMATN